MEEHRSTDVPDELSERLRKLEEEAAALREALAAKSGEVDAPATEPESADSAEDGEPEDTEGEPEPFDQATIDKIEKLLQRFRLEASRGNREIAGQYLKEAQELGPKCSLVLEVMGDDALERKQHKEALELYGQAKDALPRSLSAEKKHADLVFRTRARSAALMMTSEFENVASARSATILSVIVPGLGHIVTGDLVHGFAYLGVYVGSTIWAILTPNGIKGIVAMATNHSEPPLNAFVFVPIFISVITWLSSIISMSTRSKMVGRSLEKIERPVPLDDLPFE